MNAILKEHKNLTKISEQYENIYKFIYRIPENELVCHALTSTYKRCKRTAKYLHENMNDKKGTTKLKKNVPLCQIHCKQAVNSENNKSLKYGFYFESDMKKHFESKSYLKN
jgi:hypothetical protein